MMRNWSVDISQLKKNKEAYTIWRLEQLINYGLDGEKLDPSLVKKYWQKIDIDADARKFLSFLLWTNPFIS